MTQARQEHPDCRDYLTIFLVSGAVMLYQIALTRVLSVVVWYHFAFLTISMVMLGLGAPGVWFALARNPVRYLPGFLLAAGVTVPLSVALIVKFGTALLGKSIVSIILCVLPATLSLGGVVCLVLIKAAGPAISRVYGVDLLGAGLAAVLVIPLMHVVPTPELAAASGVLPLVCLVFRAGPARIAAWVAIAASVGLLLQGDVYQVTRSKTYDEIVSRPVYEKWSPTARITIFDESFFFLDNHHSGFSWGRGSKYPRDRRVRQYWLEQDGSAGSPITAFDGDLSAVDHLLYDVTTVGYQLRPPSRVAVIGAGGGRDILSALLAGASDIDAVELNEHTIEAVSGRFGELSGDIYHAPGVHAVANEGRSHLTYSDKTYDLIQISLIDSWAASTAGAFALAENNLYTVEAFELYAERLSDGGLLSVSRWMGELPRLLVLAYASLEAMDVTKPPAHLAVVGAQGVRTLLLSKTPFGPAELTRLDEICAERGFVRLYPVDPGRVAERPFVANLIEHRFAAMAAQGLDTDPPTDDSPYFFHMISPFAAPGSLSSGAQRMSGAIRNVESTVVLREAMIAVVFLASGLFFLPFLARVRKQDRQQPLVHLLRASLYFAAIGFAFLLMENVLIQRFVLYLGHPSYATTVIIAALLIGMGAGSIAANRFGIGRLQRLGVLVPLVLLAVAAALPPFFDATLGFPRSVRIGLSALVLVPLGAALGLFFPLGMQYFGDRAKPWYWAINGAFGVVASVLSLALSMDFGFAVVGMLSAAVYALAWLCLLGGSATPLHRSATAAALLIVIACMVR